MVFKKNNTDPVRWRIRWTLAVLSVLVLVYLLQKVIIDAVITSGPHYIYRLTRLNTPIQAAMETRFAQAKDMFQIGVIFIGGLWGLLIAKKGEARLVLADGPEILMSVSATVLLGLSFGCHLFYVSEITKVYYSAGTIAVNVLENSMKPDTLGNIIFPENTDIPMKIADIFQPGINYLFDAQYGFLVAGVINAMLTFISAHKLKHK
jgi:hypothetical protein